jgi:hypothetical protein
LNVDFAESRLSIFCDRFVKRRDWHGDRRYNLVRPNFREARSPAVPVDEESRFSGLGSNSGLARCQGRRVTASSPYFPHAIGLRFKRDDGRTGLQHGLGLLPGIRSEVETEAGWIEELPVEIDFVAELSKLLTVQKMAM